MRCNEVEGLNKIVKLDRLPDRKPKLIKLSDFIINYSKEVDEEGIKIR